MAEQTTRKTILDSALKCVCEDRDEQYGCPEDSFALIAQLREPYIRAKCVGGDADVSIVPEDVGILMCLFKIARTAGLNIKADNYIDLAGYAACAGEIALKGHV